MKNKDIKIHNCLITTKKDVIKYNKCKWLKCTYYKGWYSDLVDIQFITTTRGEVWKFSLDDLDNESLKVIINLLKNKLDTK